MSHLPLILVLGTLTAFAPVSIDMYLSAFPAIASEYGVKEAMIELSLTSFFIGMALGQLIYGPLSDRFGRKPPLYFGLLLYVAMSLGCLLAPNIETLILFRFFQALGACTGIVIARAVVRDLFKHQEAARIFSFLLLVLGVAPILAPLLGGYISAWIGWRAIFGVHAVFGFICFALVMWVLPETRQSDKQVQLKKIFQTYLSIFKNRGFLSYTVSGSLAQSGMFAYITGSSYVFIQLFHIPAERYGWFFGFNAVGLIFSSQLNARLLRTYTSEQILRKSFPLLASVSIFLSLTWVLSIGFWPMAVGLFLYLSLLGLIFPNMVAGALSEQEKNVGSASALLGCLQYLIAFAASAIVSHFHNGTGLPMTWTIGFCGVSAFLIFRKFLLQSRSASVLF
jgi:DHA1 family bicyclomycin/chloramphenicol resistance-like MFS transporter